MLSPHNLIPITKLITKRAQNTQTEIPQLAVPPKN